VTLLRDLPVWSVTVVVFPEYVVKRSFAGWVVGQTPPVGKVPSGGTSRHLRPRASSLFCCNSRGDLALGQARSRGNDVRNWDT